MNATDPDWIGGNFSWVCLDALFLCCFVLAEKAHSGMWNGFLGYPTSFMLDFVVVSLLLVVPTLLTSLYFVKLQRNYPAHRLLQVALGAILLVAVSAFEIDMTWQGGIKVILEKRSTPLTEPQSARFYSVLWVHVCFSVSTCVLWLVTLGLAMKNFRPHVQPGPHSRVHRVLGWASAIDIVCTAVTGLAVYYLGFMV